MKKILLCGIIVIVILLLILNFLSKPKFRTINIKDFEFTNTIPIFPPREQTNTEIVIGAEVKHYADYQITDMNSFKTFLAAHQQAITEIQNQEIIIESETKSEFNIIELKNFLR